jgi:hypothetical protein
MIADVLTKPLQGEQFVKLRDSLKELLTEARVGMGKDGEGYSRTRRLEYAKETIFDIEERAGK